MTRRTMIELMLERYGMGVSIKGKNVCAIIQPIQRSSRADLNLPTEYYDSLYYLYTGPSAVKLQIGDEVGTKKRHYVVKRSDAFLVGGEEVYVWAVLKALAPDADSQIYLEADGCRIASIDSYTAEVLQQSRPVFAWGEQEPVDTAAGVVHYELTLKNVCPVEGTNMYAEANLSLVAERPGKKVIYSGCRWKSIATSGGVGSKQKHTLKLTAVKRQEEVVSNG